MRPFGLSLVCCLVVQAACVGATGLESGKPIPVGTPDGRGPFAAPGVINDPLGTAFFTEGAAQPDLFVATGKFGTGPGLYLYRWAATSPEGVPVFSGRTRVSFPFGGAYPPSGTVFQGPDGMVHGVWLVGGELVDTHFDRDAMGFIEQGRVAPTGLPRPPAQVAVLPNPDGTLEVLLSISDGTRGNPTGVGGRDPAYQPYDGRGVWRGGFPYVALWAVTLPAGFSGTSENPRRVSPTDREVRSTYTRITPVRLGQMRQRDILTGSHFGALHYYHNNAAAGLQLDERLMAVRNDGNAHRHPIIHPSPVAYPDPQTGLSNLIAGGEGGLWFYRFTGSFAPNGAPVYADPVPVLEDDALLYAGTLPVPNVVDWNGDGALDIVSGNSDGQVLFFRNAGSNASPAFIPGVPVEAGGRAIHVQPGYGQDIQGPGEARWGYTCPAVADWNSDGLLDILMSDSTARHMVYLNRGTLTAPVLDAEHPLYFDDLDLHGTWRVKPAVAKLDGRMAYVALDDDDQFHLFWRVDDHQVSDGGKLKLEDGSVVGANFLSAGGSGRLKLNLVDWDRDGRVDLLVGTPRHGSVPNTNTGLPQSLGLPGSAVLFLRNVGTNQAPVFRFPELMKFRGEPIFLGQHACAPTPAFFSGGDGPDLIVGEETGHLLYYAREDLTPK